MTVKAGSKLVQRTVPFSRDLDNSAFEFLTPEECGGLRVLFSTVHVMTCGSKGIKGDYLRVLCLRAQGQEKYGGKERA